jgi:serine/threonine protein kinase
VLPEKFTRYSSRYLSDLTLSSATAPVKSESRDYKADIQVFARKVIRIFGDISVEYVQNELRAIDKLREPGHRNVVDVLKHGELLYMSLYFIDMELCDMNLETFIHGESSGTIDADSLYSPIHPSSLLKVEQIRGIVTDITDGLAYIHGHGEVHRDLKPANG